MKSSKKNEIHLLIDEFIGNFIAKVYEFYLSLDNSLVINGKRINLRKEEIRKASLDYDVNFYFDFFNSISEYRETLKSSISNSELQSLLQNVNSSYSIESRLKNINSISSKIYQFINVKKEKGYVSINKCLNDLFGLRIILPYTNRQALLVTLQEIAKEHEWKFKIIDATKKGYKAVHLYMSKDNFSFPWEIQFWLRKNDTSNRDSHAKYKQSYTSWEYSYSNRELYEVHKK